MDSSFGILSSGTSSQPCGNRSRSRPVSHSFPLLCLLHVLHLPLLPPRLSHTPCSQQSNYTRSIQVIKILSYDTVSMSAWFCPTTLAKFWRLVGCFKSRQKYSLPNKIYRNMSRVSLTEKMLTKRVACVAIPNPDLHPWRFIWHSNVSLPKTKIIP